MKRTAHCHNKRSSSMHYATNLILWKRKVIITSQELLPYQLPSAKSSTSSSTRHTSKSHKPNPFGAAKPREEVLAKKGIDFHDIDDRIQKKASVAHFSREQEIHIQILQNDLIQAEDALREANEKELPEDTLREIVDERRKAFNDLMMKYKKENEGKKIGENDRFDGVQETYSRTKRFENHRYSSTRYKKSKDDALDPFASFHRKDRSHEKQYRRNY